MYSMFSENGSKNRRAEDQLLEQFLKFKINEIENGTGWSEYIHAFSNKPPTLDPKTLSIKYNEIPPEEAIGFNYQLEDTHLLVNTWAHDYDEGVKMVSGYFALRSAVRNYNDKFLNRNRLLLILYVFFFCIIWVFSILAWMIPHSSRDVAASYGSFFHVVRIVCLILYLFIFIYYWLLLIKWKKRTQIRLDGNLKEIGLILTKPELKLLIRREDSVFIEMSLQIPASVILIWIILMYLGILF